VVLPDEPFDPRDATYVIDGDDLVVTPEGGGVLVFDGFFAHPGNPPTLSVLGGPPVSASDLLARADLAAPPAQPVTVAEIPVPDETDTGAGPPRGKETAGGGADFAPYDPGDIGPGLDPLGPLGPTALAYSAEFPEPDEGFGDAGDGDGGRRAAGPAEPPPGPGPEPPPPEPPPPTGPAITIGGATVGLVAERSAGFQFVSTADEPALVEKRPIAPGSVNGIDPGNATLDAQREVSVVFEGEVARLKNSLGVFQVQQAGQELAFSDARLVFPDVNSTEAIDPPRLDGSGPLEPGVSSFPLGSLSPGTQLGFFLVSDGANLNGWTGLPDGSAFADGTFELRQDGNDLTLLQNGVPVEGVLFVTVDPDPSDPRVNVLNPDGRTHVASWYDSASGDLVFAIEDRALAGPTRGDGDFNDNVFRLHFGPVADQELFYGDAPDGGAFNVSITDDGELNGAELQLTSFRDGDRLALAPGADADGDGVIDGTTISIQRAGDTGFVLSGAGTPGEYESALNSIRLENDTNPVPGDRTASLVVTDAEGNRSDPATITVSILDPVDDGGRGGDTLVGTDSFDALAGRAGDDTIFGRGRADFLDGGDGDDRLFGEGGNDILVGGPGRDQLTGGPGADRYVFTSLGDGRDTILDFNAEEGDRLDLRQLFEGTGFDPGAADAGDFLRFEALDGGGGDTTRVGVVADLDGAGATHVPAQVATLVNPVGVAPGTAVADVATFTGSDGATA
jgi:hypothetical protein